MIIIKTKIIQIKKMIREIIEIMENYKIIGILVVLLCLLLLVIFVYLLLNSVKSVFPTFGKTKGGTATYKNEPVSLVNVGVRYFPCLGLEFTDRAHKFYVLNQRGEDYVLTDLHELMQKHILYISAFYDDVGEPVDFTPAILRTVIKAPFRVFNISEGNSNSTGMVALPKSDVEKETELNGVREMNFENILEKHVTGYEKVLKRYDDLCGFMKQQFSGFFDEVSFIGQPAFFAGKTEVKDPEKELQGVRFSLNKKFTKGDSVYKACKGFLRSWYSSSFSKFFNKHYFNKISGEGETFDSSIDYYVNRENFNKNFSCDVDYLKREAAFYSAKLSEISGKRKKIEFVKMTFILFDHVSEKLGKVRKDVLKEKVRRNAYKTFMKDQKRLVKSLETFENCTNKAVFKEDKLQESLQRLLVLILLDGFSKEKDFDLLLECLTTRNRDVELMKKWSSDAEVLTQVLTTVNGYYVRMAREGEEYSDFVEKSKFCESSVEFLRNGGYPSVCDINVNGRKAGSVPKPEKNEQKETGDYADIYPALKLFMSIFLIFGYRLNYKKYRVEKDDKNIEELDDDTSREYDLEFFEMLASYVIYAHLFNIFCCVRMEKTWNEKIGNLYVYNFKTKRGKTVMMEIDKESYDDAAIDFALNSAASYDVLKSITRAGKKLGKKKFLSVIRKKEDIFKSYTRVVDTLKNIRALDWLSCESENKRVNLILDALYDFVRKGSTSMFDVKFNFGMFAEGECAELMTFFKKVELTTLDFLAPASEVEDKYQNLVQLFVDKKVLDDKFDLLLILDMLADMSAYIPNTDGEVHRKIERLILNFKDAIKTFFEEKDIIELFRRNKGILLFCLQENILNFDNSFIEFLTNDPYDETSFMFFAPEILRGMRGKERLTSLDKLQKRKAVFFVKKEGDSERIVFERGLNELVEDKDYEKKRKLGGNSDNIAMLIRKDDIEGFIQNFDQGTVSPEYEIKSSLFETNLFLIEKKSLTVLEYAIFHGAEQIARFLSKNGAEIQPRLLEFACFAGKKFYDTLESEVPEDLRKYDAYLLNAMRVHDFPLINFIFEEHGDDVEGEFALANFLMLHNFTALNSCMGVAKDTNKTLIMLILCEYKYHTFMMFDKKSTDAIDENYRGMLVTLSEFERGFGGDPSVREDYNGENFILSFFLDSELERKRPRSGKIDEMLGKISKEYFSDSRLGKLYDFVDKEYKNVKNDDNGKKHLEQILEKLENTLKNRAEKIWDEWLNIMGEGKDRNNRFSKLQDHLLEMLKNGENSRVLIREVFECVISFFEGLGFPRTLLEIALEKIIDLFEKFPVYDLSVGNEKKKKEKVLSNKISREKEKLKEFIPVTIIPGNAPDDDMPAAQQSSTLVQMNDQGTLPSVHDILPSGESKLLIDTYRGMETTTKLFTGEKFENVKIEVVKIRREGLGETVEWYREADRVEIQLSGPNKVRVKCSVWDEEEEDYDEKEDGVKLSVSKYILIENRELRIRSHKIYHTGEED